MSKTILHKRSKEVLDDGSAYAPGSGDLAYGEIAVNYADGVETLFIKNSANAVFGLPMSVGDDVSGHIADTDNPHGVTAEDIGLENVNNTADTDKPVSDAMQEVLDTKMNVSDVYDSAESSSTIDLETVPWSAAQGYTLYSTISSYGEDGVVDTSEIEARILACEVAVGLATESE